jgi:hypothetical protein
MFMIGRQLGVSEIQTNAKSRKCARRCLMNDLTLLWSRRASSGREMREKRRQLFQLTPAQPFLKFISTFC